VLGLGGRTLKRSTGPDLLSLFIGSEGTLGLFTEIALAVTERPARRMGVAVPLPKEISLASVVLRLRRERSLGLSAVEYVDATCAAALAGIPGSRLPGAEATLLCEVESESESAEERQLEGLGALLRELGVPAEPLVYPDADRLWTLRGESGSALARKVGPTVREDIAVPPEALDELFTSIEQIARRLEVPVHTFGHLGEANLHPNFVVDPGNPVAESIRRSLYETTRRLGGTLSGEHGIGAVKAPYLELELGGPGIEALRGVKRVFDPDGILNPGKVYPVR
ncbi:MAG: FAD-binding oxidoreductase, partial [Candidatus Lutacidiplasmatales archaeon]